MNEIKKPDNPNAFPTMETGFDKFVNPSVLTYEGMTLRDYFANSVDGAKISEGYSLAFAEEIVGRKKPDITIELLKFWFEFESILQYLKADAMLRQRDVENQHEAKSILESEGYSFETGV